MNAIDNRTRQPRNLVNSGDSLVSDALSLTTVGATNTLPDTSTARTVTLTPACRLFTLNLLTPAFIAVGVGVTGATPTTAILGAGTYTIQAPFGSTVMLKRAAGTGTEPFYLTELG